MTDVSFDFSQIEGRQAWMKDNSRLDSTTIETSRANQQYNKTSAHLSSLSTPHQISHLVSIVVSLSTLTLFLSGRTFHRWQWTVYPINFALLGVSEITCRYFYKTWDKLLASKEEMQADLIAALLTRKEGEEPPSLPTTPLSNIKTPDHYRWAMQITGGLTAIGMGISIAAFSLLYLQSHNLLPTSLDLHPLTLLAVGSTAAIGASILIPFYHLATTFYSQQWYYAMQRRYSLCDLNYFSTLVGTQSKQLNLQSVPYAVWKGWEALDTKHLDYANTYQSYSLSDYQWQEADRIALLWDKAQWFAVRTPAVIATLALLYPLVRPHFPSSIDHYTSQIAQLSFWQHSLPQAIVAEWNTHYLPQTLLGAWRAHPLAITLGLRLLAEMTSWRGRILFGRTQTAFDRWLNDRADQFSETPPAHPEIQQKLGQHALPPLAHWAHYLASTTLVVATVAALTPTLSTYLFAHYPKQMEHLTAQVVAWAAAWNLSPATVGEWGLKLLPFLIGAQHLTNTSISHEHGWHLNRQGLPHILHLWNAKLDAEGKRLDTSGISGAVWRGWRDISDDIGAHRNNNSSE